MRWLAQWIHLRNEQREAIEAEDYETAARLRDEIATLEVSLKPAKETKPRSRRKPRPEKEA